MYNKLICITSRNLCGGGFIQRVRDILDMGIPVILREKDMTEKEYFKLLNEIDRQDITAHSFPDAARSFGCRKIHLPLPLLERADISGFELVGSSTHCAQQAKRAAELGASYITAGHIFNTECKKGLEPHGPELLTEISRLVNIPVYALGGISPLNAAQCTAAGAYGVCAMSGFMKCRDLCAYIEGYKHILG
ncbi:MAG: thiamine phosphate synthase [Clostridiales bacterium]|nr:thiamine phosphate synthase [Clostridiales bacterium]